MVAHILRLKLQLLLNSLRRSPWQVVGLVVGAFYGLAVVVLGVIGFVALRAAEPEIAGSVVTVVGAAILLGFLVVPLATGVDDAMDPRRFSLLAVDNRDLVRGLSLAALISIPSVALVLIALAQIATWSRGALPVILAILAAAAILVSGVLSARVSTSLAGLLLSSRRARDTTGIVTIVAVILASPLIVLLVNVDWMRDGLRVLGDVGAVAGWTPFGAAWAAPAAAAAGDVGGAFLRILIAAGYAALLWWAWRRLVAAMLVTPHREAQARDYIGLGWFGLLPGRSTGAIAARSLTYWGRDPRYRVSLIVIPILPVLMFVPLSIAGVPGNVLWLLPVPVMALFLSWSIHNDVAFDNTAIWAHVSAHVAGRADRWGRALPVLLAGAPLVLLGSVLSAAAYGDLGATGAVLGVSFALLLTGVGLSSMTSAAFPYPAVRPNDSPFQQPQAAGTAAAVVQGVSFLVCLVLVAPTIYLAVRGFLEPGPWHLWALAVGFVTGLVVLVAGVAIGARLFDRRTPELLAFALRNA